ncbi:MAG: hypothetical protein GY795_01235 [Desulfobacterales bacterium]|nr:hypothetical protein [Desulfobacterales bacterium]
MKKIIGKKLTDALTTSEIAWLLDAVFEAMSKEQVTDALLMVDENIEQTVSQLLSSKKPKKSKIVSDNKFLEGWRELWKTWNKIVTELGDEEGDYVCQEHHWEAPYFDSYQLAEDLDKVAVEILPLLERIRDMGEEEDILFKEAMEEIEGGIQSYPEWMGAEYGDCYVNAGVVHCLLKWTWLCTDSAEIFFKHMKQIKVGLELITLERKGYIDFFAGLPEDARKEFYDYFTSNRNDPAWEEDLNNTGSLWHQIYHDLSGSFDQDAYFETCRRLLHENWEYGPPLIQDLLDKGDQTEAEKVCGRTINSFVGRRDKKAWNPEKSLLTSANTYGYGPPEDAIIKLLHDWIGIAGKTKADALKFQLVTYKTPYDWDKVATIIEKAEISVVSSLVVQWQKFCVDRTGKQSHDCWIKWLMDADLDKSKGTSWLFKKISKWLADLSDNPKALNNQKKLFFTLTLDMAELSDFKKQYPHVHEVVKLDRWQSDPQEKSRQKWLKKMDGISFVPLLTDCWKKQAPSLVPNPANAHKANYEYHAMWLVAVNELSPAAYQEVVAQWKQDHSRRRNLWQAVRNAGLYV